MAGGAPDLPRLEASALSHRRPQAAPARHRPAGGEPGRRRARRTGGGGAGGRQRAAALAADDGGRARRAADLPVRQWRAGPATHPAAALLRCPRCCHHRRLRPAARPRLRRDPARLRRDLLPGLPAHLRPGGAAARQSVHRGAGAGAGPPAAEPHRSGGPRRRLHRRQPMGAAADHGAVAGAPLRPGAARRRRLLPCARRPGRGHATHPAPARARRARLGTPCPRLSPPCAHGGGAGTQRGAGRGAGTRRSDQAGA